MLYPRVINEYERGVLFSFGKYSGVMDPGLKILVMVYHSLEVVDMRIKTIDIPKQEVMTKDNVPVKINAVIYFKVYDPEKAILNVKDYIFATSRYSQTAMRNVAGEASLDELLSERQKIADNLREIVDIATDPWGIKVTAIELQDIELPENLKRTMAKQAEAEREKRGVIINSEGELIASQNIAKAAKTLYDSSGALHLRTLQTINDLSSDRSGTVVYALPIEVLRVIERMGDLLEKRDKKHGGDAV
ncbi:MAG: slipin family protein [Candidatus Altiarchaeales archaeon]|nr:slipin family protein [Candidatus Altiarchaeales archaeon]MBD3416207.1 slipin family protein [Candidatus Altiarchaeales archaeon]